MARPKAPKPPRTVDLDSPPAYRTRSRVRAAPAPPAPPPPPLDDSPVFILTGADGSTPHTPKRPKRRGRAAQGTAQTPMVFLDRDMPCRRSTRLRAASVAFYHDFCEISHMPNTCSVVQGCHCLPHCWMNDTFEDLVAISFNCMNDTD